MKLALSLAKATIGQTSPNPSVGAVVVQNGEIVGLGTHLRAGTPHAEVHAIRNAGERACGADLYVTLEPCSHFGKTPPCADLIIEAGIKRVFVATLDPNPLVSGRGVQKLEQAGIEVVVGIEKDIAEKMNAPFFHFIRTNTPFVTLKAAITLDGKIATKTGESKWITSPEARLDVHQLRHEHDAILVGINTILTDNPLLTARLPEGSRNPIRIVLDTHLQTPVEANIIQDASARTIIFTGSEIDPERKRVLQRSHVVIYQLSTPTISIHHVLDILGKENIMSILVEGGADIHASFVSKRAFQQLIFYVAPKLLGGRSSLSVIGGSDPIWMKEAAELEFVEVKQIGPDLKITAQPRKKDE